MNSLSVIHSTEPRASRTGRYAWHRDVLVIALLLSGCTTGSGVDEPMRRLRPTEVARLSLVRLDSLVLTIPEGVVQGITEFARRDNGYVVLDGFGKRVHLFDSRGGFVSTFGGKGDGPGEFRDPMSLALNGDTIVVVDPGRGRALNTFDPNGEFVAVEQLPLPLPPLIVRAGSDNRIYVLTYPVDTPIELAEMGRERMWVLGNELEVVGRGCRADPRYIESAAKDGEIDRFRGGDLAVHRARLYCVQGISPVIQVMDAEGDLLGTIAVEPPFYEGPIDRPANNLNQKEIFRFLSEWTFHRRIFPLQNGAGFVSVYSRVDEVTGDFRYWLFRCALDGAFRVSRCGSVEIPEKPVLITPGGEVFLEEELAANGAPVVGIYRMSGPGIPQ